MKVSIIGANGMLSVALTKYFSYYTEGYWKDQHLLDAVTEMDYYFSIMENKKL